LKYPSRDLHTFISPYEKEDPLQQCIGRGYQEGSRRILTQIVIYTTALFVVDGVSFNKHYHEQTDAYFNKLDTSWIQQKGISMQNCFFRRKLVVGDLAMNHSKMMVS